MTQGDPISPTIFNEVVDAVLRHWVRGVIADTEEQGEWGKEGRHQADLFYADDGMVASSDPDESRVLSKTWSACLTGWACGQLSVRQLTWSATPSRRQEIYRRRRTGGGSQGKAPRTGSA